MKPASALTPKQAAFVREYLIDLNATRAMIRAGYSAKTAGVTSAQLLEKPRIREAVDIALSRRFKRLDITADRVLTEYARVAFLDPAEMFDDEGRLHPIKKMPEDVRRAISGVDVEKLYDYDKDGERAQIGNIHKIRITNKLGALESLAKYLNLIRDTSQVQVNTGLSIHIHPYKEND